MARQMHDQHHLGTITRYGYQASCRILYVRAEIRLDMRLGYLFKLLKLKAEFVKRGETDKTQG